MKLGIAGKDAAAAMVSGAMVGLAFPPVAWWPFSVISQIAFLWFLRNRSVAEARNFGLIYGLAYFGSTMYWLFGLFGKSAISLIALSAAYYGILANLVALTPTRGAVTRSVGVAVFAVGIEWLRGDAWYLRFPWYTVPHSLALAPFLIWPLQYLGTYGFSFVVWFIGALGCFKRPMIWAALLFIPLVGFVGPNQSAPDSTAVVIQAEGFDAVEKVIPHVPNDRVSLAVLPEYAYFVSPELALTSPNGPARLARSLRCPVVFGAVDGVYGDMDFQNVAVVVDSAANILGKFPKQRPVPLFVDGQPGRVRPVFPVEMGILGVGVCYDFDAPAVAASLVRKGATVLIAPTFDASDWGRTQHLHHELLLRLRAVELKRWIVRAASSGRSESIDPFGRPSSAGVEIDQSGFAHVPYAHLHDITPAAYLDLLGPVCAVLSVLLIGLELFRRHLA